MCALSCRSAHEQPDCLSARHDGDGVVSDATKQEREVMIKYEARRVGGVVMVGSHWGSEEIKNLVRGEC